MVCVASCARVFLLLFFGGGTPAGFCAQVKSRKRGLAKSVGEKTTEQKLADEATLRLREEVNNVAERRRDFDAGKKKT